MVVPSFEERRVTRSRCENERTAAKRVRKVFESVEICSGLCNQIYIKGLPNLVSAKRRFSSGCDYLPKFLGAQIKNKILHRNVTHLTKSASSGRIRSIFGCHCSASEAVATPDKTNAVLQQTVCPPRMSVSKPIADNQRVFWCSFQAFQGQIQKVPVKVCPRLWL